MAQDVSSRIEHDVRHELGTIRILADVLSESADVGSVSRIRVRQLVAEVSWLELLVRLRHEQSAGNGTPTGECRPLRLDRMLDEVLRTARISASTRIRTASDPAVVRADRLALGRALRNLVWNALDAAGPAGEVEVDLRTVGSQVIVRIEDDGPGFDPDRVDEAGLGLRTVYEFAATAGGDVRVARGANGTGCRITLTLPLDQAHSGGGSCAS
ncbi:MAG: sensor histidine kinase [Jatrophihabitantaceae bacterium]